MKYMDIASTFSLVKPLFWGFSSPITALVSGYRSVRLFVSLDRPLPGRAWSSALCNSIIALYTSRARRVADSQPAASEEPSAFGCCLGVCPGGERVWRDSMQVRFWGTRGSIATPGPSTMRYGGNTSCVEVRLDDGALLIFDAGTGLRAL